MAIKQFKPYTPGRRFMTVQDKTEISRKDPERSLLAPLNRTGGRNNNGLIVLERVPW